MEEERQSFSDAYGPARPHWQPTSPARIHYSDVVKLGCLLLFCRR